MINYIRAVEECFKAERGEAFITRWHYNLAQFYGPGYVAVKIRWDELSHMGLLWYLVNGSLTLYVAIELCIRAMEECISAKR